MKNLRLNLIHSTESLRKILISNLNVIGDLKISNIEHASDSDQKFTLIADFLKKDRTVKYVVLESSNLCPHHDQQPDMTVNALPIICAALAHNTSVQELTISGTHLTRSGLEAVASMLVTQGQSSDNPKLLRLIRLNSSLSIDSSGFCNFAVILAQNVNFLEFLDLSYNKLVDEHAEILTGMACSLPNLRAMNLDVNSITDVGAQSLLDLAEITATKISLNNNLLSDATKEEVKKDFLETKKENKFFNELNRTPTTFFALLPADILKMPLRCLDHYENQAVNYLTPDN